MSDNEVEEVLFLPGETAVNKKSVYEPSRPQQLKQIVCSRSRAVVVAIVMGAIILAIALVAAFARKGGIHCMDSATPPPTEPSKPAPEDLIATNGKKFPWEDIILPKDVIPQSYHIKMHVNLTTFTFTGTVNINVKAVKPTDFLVLHIKNLDISEFSVKSTANDKSILCTEYMEYTKFEEFYMKLERMLLENEEINVELSFNGTLGGSNLAGFYKSSYKTKNGETRYLATTHFEPTSARAAFPCFDEPELKANFSMSIIHDKGLISLFNTKMISSEPYQNGLLLDKFETSVKMSTYLVAFVVCDYAHIENTTVHGTRVRVYTPPEQISQATFALDVATKVLAYYEQYFGVPYPLKKQDLIAIPDFGAGAMENWGLITYRMTAILYDEVESSLLSRQWIAVVIAHELAHQWFGNLVTMKWWNDLWLNEGFASYVELIGSNYVQPNWKMFQQFIVNDLQAALHLDALANSHPIMVPVHNPNEINEIFDKISYDKGSSILRMLNNFLGETTFKTGLTAYLKKYQFSNAETKDLWDAWSEASGSTIDVSRIMDTWTLQMGYPVVTLTMSSGGVQATQERFLIHPKQKNNKRSGFESPYGYKWYVPLTYVTSKSPTNSMTVWMNKTAASFTVPSDISWIKANTDQYGYYRVNYDEAMWQRIISELTTNAAVFSPEDRAGLLDDAFSFARSRLLPQSVALDLTEYLVHEKDYIPWRAALDSLGYLETRLYNTDAYALYQKYLLNLLKQLTTELGWEDSGIYLTRLLRGVILQKAIQLNDPNVTKEASAMFSNWMNRGMPLNPNLKTAVYYGGIVNGGQAEWDFCWRRYIEVQTPSEKQEMLVALSRTKNVQLLKLYLKNSLDETKIRSQDTVSVIRYVSRNPSGTNAAWKFVQMNWDILMKRYGESAFTMNSLITGTTSSFQTQYDYNKVKDFFHTHETGAAKRAVKQSLESIQMNIDWLNNSRLFVEDWLEHNHGAEE